MTDDVNFTITDLNFGDIKIDKEQYMLLILRICMKMVSRLFLDLLVRSLSKMITGYQLVARVL